MHILGLMQQALPHARTEISQHAPRMITFKINPEKIRDVIGKGGAVIRALTEETGCTIDIKDDGTVTIASVNADACDAARKRIEDITAEVEVGRIYEGPVLRLLDFGAIVQLLPGKDGLLHISQIAKERVNAVADYLKEGQIVRVKVHRGRREGPRAPVDEGRGGRGRAEGLGAAAADGRRRVVRGFRRTRRACRASGAPFSMARRRRKSAPGGPRGSRIASPLTDTVTSVEPASSGTGGGCGGHRHLGARHHRVGAAAVAGLDRDAARPPAGRAESLRRRLRARARHAAIACWVIASCVRRRSSSESPNEMPESSDPSSACTRAAVSPIAAKSATLDLDRLHDAPARRLALLDDLLRRVAGRRHLRVGQRGLQLREHARDARVDLGGRRDGARMVRLGAQPRVEAVVRHVAVAEALTVTTGTGVGACPALGPRRRPARRRRAIRVARRWIIMGSGERAAAARGSRRGWTTRTRGRPLRATAATHGTGARAARASPAPARVPRARRRARCCASCRAASDGATSGRSRRRWSCASRGRRRARPRRSRSPPRARAPRCARAALALPAAGHRLPVAREIGAFEQQHVEVAGVNEDERRNGVASLGSDPGFHRGLTPAFSHPRHVNTGVRPQSPTDPERT